eukprot:5725963-Karenia_brevis.AAC.1
MTRTTRTKMKVSKWATIKVVEKGGHEKGGEQGHQKNCGKSNEKGGGKGYKTGFHQEDQRTHTDYRCG